MTYAIAVERGEQNLAELIHLYKAHYDEMRQRVPEIGPFGMNVPEYARQWLGGGLINYVARQDGRAIGYCNAYLSASMHNQGLVAFVDALFVLPDHRGGIGRKLLDFVMSDMKARGAKSITIGCATDMRLPKLLARMKFKELAVEMIHTFDEAENHV